MYYFLLDKVKGSHLFDTEFCLNEWIAYKDQFLRKYAEERFVLHNAKDSWSFKIIKKNIEDKKNS